MKNTKIHMFKDNQSKQVTAKYPSYLNRGLFDTMFKLNISDSQLRSESDLYSLEKLVFSGINDETIIYVRSFKMAAYYLVQTQYNESNRLYLYSCKDVYFCTKVCTIARSMNKNNRVVGQIYGSESLSFYQFHVLSLE
jgi:hypothetical protein